MANELTQELLSFEPAVEDDFLLDKQLRSIRISIEKANPAVLSNINLDLFDPSIHTLSYLLILNFRIQNLKPSGPPGKASDKNSKQVQPQGTLWPYITNLLLNFDPVQVRYAGAAFMSIYQGMAMASEQTDDLAVAIQILHGLILRLDPTSSTLTPAHYTLIRLCLRGRAFQEGANILERPIFSLPYDTDKASQSRASKYFCSYQESSATYLTPQTGLNVRWTYRQYLEYFLWGGMIFMALRNYSRAKYYLEVVLTAPTQNAATTSMVQVEAYKKWVLVTLLLKGQSVSPPRGIGTGTWKNIRALSKVYDCLADAFKTNDLPHFQAEINAAQKYLQDDNNFCLAVELYHSFRKFQVQKLGKTFAALPVADVARRTSPNPADLAETTAYLSSLIAARGLNAVLSTSPDTKETTLCFLTNTPNASARPESQIARSLSHQRAELQILLRAIGDNEHRLAISREYIDMLKKLKKAKDLAATSGGGEDGGAGGGSGAARQPFSPILAEEDEDMMADE